MFFGEVGRYLFVYLDPEIKIAIVPLGQRSDASEREISFGSICKFAKVEWYGVVLATSFYSTRSSLPFARLTFADLKVMIIERCKTWNHLNIRIHLNRFNFHI